MGNKPIYIDIHCHPSMKPFYSSKKHSEKKNIWEHIPENEVCKRIHKSKKKNKRKNKKNKVVEMIRYSQMNLDSCLEEGLRVLFISLYPIERGWFNERGIVDMVTSDKKIARMAACMSGINLEIVTEIQKVIDKNKKEINYFDELAREYHYLNSDQAKSSETGKQFIIAKSYDEIKAVLDNPEDKRLVLIVSIEGGHSLCKFDNFNDLKYTPFKKVDSIVYPEYKKYKDIYFNHIDVLKGVKDYSIKVDGEGQSIRFEHTPLYITFAHHFWNLLCGHSDSFGFGPDLALNQGYQKGEGFTKLGKAVLHKLLQKSDKERRILIDIKHLSIKSRGEFYEIWEKEYNAKGDGFPIISSHAALNGRINHLPLIHNDDDDDENPYKSFFNLSEINMFDEDIVMIHKSNGLFGLILNETRLPGLESRDFLKYNKNKIKDIEKRFRKNKITKIEKDKQIGVLRNENKQEYLKCITANIFHIARVINEKNAWDIISIGSDFDGMIDALDSYTTAKDFPVMAKDLIDFIDNGKGIEEVGLSAADMKKLKFGYTTKEIIDKIMSGNALEFLRKHFNDEFLKSETVPHSGEVIV